MLRCGQMVLAQALILNYLGRDWTWIGCSKFSNEDDNKIKTEFEDFNDLNDNQQDIQEISEQTTNLNDLIKKNEQECIDYAKSNQEHEIYIKILKQFQDKKTSQYSIHQIALMGATEDKPVGTWFGPNTIAQTLKYAKAKFQS